MFVTTLDELIYHIALPSSIQSSDIGNVAAQLEASDTVHPIVIVVQSGEYTEMFNPELQAFVPPGLEYMVPKL